MAANDLCIKAKARYGSVKQLCLSGLVCSGLHSILGAQWLSCRVLDSRPRGCGFEPQRCHCVVSLSKRYNHSLLLVQSRKTRPCIAQRLLMERKESNQTNKYTAFYTSNRGGGGGVAVITFFHYNKCHPCKAFCALLIGGNKEILLLLPLIIFNQNIWPRMLWVLKRPLSMRRFFWAPKI